MLVRTQKDSDHPFVMINKGFLHDTRLSLKAKGLLAYCMSMPTHWEFNINQLVSILKEGRESIQKIFKELIEYGYCIYTQKRNDKGTFDKGDYILHETPLSSDKLKLCSPQTGNPSSDKTPESFKKCLPQTEKPSPGFQAPALYISNNEVSNNPLTLPTQQESLGGGGGGGFFTVLGKIAMTDSDKMRLSANHPEELVARVVDFVSRPGFKPRGSIDSAIFYYCKYPSRMGSALPTQEVSDAAQSQTANVMGLNKKWGEEVYKNLLEKDPNNFDFVSVTGDGMWFKFNSQRLGRSAANFIRFCDHGFKERVESNLRKLNIW
jgi:hypothetical protein